MKTVLSYGLVLGGLLLVLLNVSTGCDKTITEPYSNTVNPAGPAANEVWIQQDAFNPSSITVGANTTVTWTNKDTVDHTVVSDGGLFTSGTLGRDASFTHKFTSAGTFPYHCSLQTQMTGTVVVQ